MVHGRLDYERARVVLCAEIGLVFVGQLAVVGWMVDDTPLVTGAVFPRHLRLTRGFLGTQEMSLIMTQMLAAGCDRCVRELRRGLTQKTLINGARMNQKMVARIPAGKRVRFRCTRVALTWSSLRGGQKKIKFVKKR
eukprot:1112799-Amorphochlora_amoeboformis.AAC.1